MARTLAVTVAAMDTGIVHSAAAHSDPHYHDNHWLSFIRLYDLKVSSL